MISPTMVMALCLLGGVGLMALVISVGMSECYRDDRSPSAAINRTPSDPARRGRAVTVRELFAREHAGSMTYASARRRSERP
jgi:hypothetical protein